MICPPLQGSTVTQTTGALRRWGGGEGGGRKRKWEGGGGGGRGSERAIIREWRDKTKAALDLVE